MRGIRWVVALAAVPMLAAAAQGPDTNVVFRGIVMRDTGSAWALFIPVPAQVQNIRFNLLHLTKTGGIDRDENRYAEVTGRLGANDAGSPVLEVAKLKLISIPGEVERTVSRSFTEHAEVAAGILPNQFAFPDSGQAQRVRVRPVIVFAITNHSDAPIDFSFRDNKLICASVLPSTRTQEPIWTGAWPVGPYLTSIQINLSSTVREAVTLPDSVTLPPGHYKLRVWLCEAADYNAVTTFDVVRE